MREEYISLGGGIDERVSSMSPNPGLLIEGVNVEAKTDGGYRRAGGITKFDTTAVPGEGDILGVWRYGGVTYAFRNAAGGATAVMHSSTGSGWTAKKTGLTPDGCYCFENYSFAGTQKMYGVSGTHKAFEWDGTTWTDITTGMTTDTPNQIIGFKNHLFLSFGASVQHSAIGDPFTWTLLAGANELAISHNVTGFMRMSGGVLGIFSENNTNFLSGSSSADFVNTNLNEYGLNIGASYYSLQQLGSRVFYHDDRGILDVQAAEKFGDFSDATISLAVSRYLKAQKSKISSSTISKDKSQYRIYFSDGYGLFFTFNRTELKGITKVLLKNSSGTALPILKCANTEDSSGDEVNLFGSNDGYIYVMDDGNSFDGYPIEAKLETVFTSLKMPRREKRMHRIVFDIHTDGASSIYVTPNYQFNGISIEPQTVSLQGYASILGEIILGTTVLGDATISDGSVYAPGSFEYVSVTVISNNTDSDWEIDGILYVYKPGRRLR